MAVEVASLFAKIGLDKSQLESGLKSAEKSVGGFGSAIGSVGKLLGGLAIGGAIVGGLKSAVGAASDFESQINVLSNAAPLINTHPVLMLSKS